MSEQPVSDGDPVVAAPRRGDRGGFEIRGCAVGLCLVLAGCAAVAVPIVAFAAVRRQVDPRALPAGREYFVVVSDGRMEATIECPSPWAWLNGHHDEVCRPAVTASLGSLRGAFFLLAIFLFIGVTYFFSPPSNDPDRTLGMKPWLAAVLTVIVAVPLLTALVLVVLVSPLAALAALGAGLGAWFVAGRIADRAVVPGKAAPTGSATFSVAHTGSALEPLRDDRIWLLIAKPLVVQGSRAPADVIEHLGEHYPPVGNASPRDRWMVTEPIEGGVHLTIAEPNAVGRTSNNLYLDGVLSQRAEGSEFRGWMRRHPVAALGQQMYSFLLVFLGVAWLIAAAQHRDSSVPGGVALTAAGLALMFTIEAFSAKHLAREVANLCAAMNGPASRPADRVPRARRRVRTTDEHRARVASGTGPAFAAATPQTRKQLLTATASASAMAITCLIALSHLP